MTLQPLSQSDPAVLSALFTLGKDPDVPWTDNDHAAILRHQLAQRLGPNRDGEPDGWNDKTYLDLFRDGKPALARLRQLKDRFKLGVHDDEHLPRNVSAVLYYAALSAARLHAGQAISRLSEDDFAQGLQWALDLPWITPELRPLLLDTLAQLPGAR